MTYQRKPSLPYIIPFVFLSRLFIFVLVLSCYSVERDSRVLVELPRQGCIRRHAVREGLVMVCLQRARVSIGAGT
jgi:hypothetical protein